MKLARLSVLGFAATLAVALAACPGPTFIVQQYRGPQRSPDTIAVLRINGGDTVRLLFLDDEDVAAPIASDGRLHIEMLPARHTLSVASTSAPNDRFLPLAFQAEAGKVYRIAIVPSADAAGATTARVFEVDRSKDTAVRDVTLAPGGTDDAPSPAVRVGDAGTPDPLTSDGG